jgi:hypothetical protein
MSVCCECCVLSGRDLCVGLVSRPEESYRLWCVCVLSRKLTVGASAHEGDIALWAKNGELVIIRKQTPVTYSVHCPVNFLERMRETAKPLWLFPERDSNG